LIELHPASIPLNQNIGQLLTRRAYRDPGLEAVYDAGSGQQLSYSELNASCNRTANAFRDLGLVKGDEIPRNPSGKILKRALREQYPYNAPE
jgi:acyl-CoA synthetase (AMP-forming)/AMP-acid ligase II